ncbi:MAG: biotin--[acetyl-CoA-carboxylase] ligase [Cyanobacteria bacterium CRU_2_1]|nr:biotin--[acetyl-CoA-carboxylase] ligase [Cyanobacteria bacterium RU_5_0]NJR57676.1 biotin--[acetyl-CoA-carboxylase] ligase [Cyanobacteria bacterium CRU_2_1]
MQPEQSTHPLVQKPELPEFPATFEIHLFETVASTNTVVWQMLEQGAGAGTVAIALSQQAGRGQWGRQWNSPPGGLYLSLALTPNLPTPHAGQLTLSSVWGIAVALRQYGISVQIKWLNDLVMDGYKLGGILTETRIYQEQIYRAVIGVGINWSNWVPEMGINLQTILAKQGVQSIDSLETLAAIVLQGLRVGYEYWRQWGIETLIDRYQTLLVNLGQRIIVDGHPGKIIGVSITGQLRVQSERGDRSSTSPNTPTEMDLNPGEISLGYITRSKGFS